MEHRTERRIAAHRHMAAVPPPRRRARVPAPLLVALAAGLLMVTGCGGSGGDDTAPGASATTTTGAGNGNGNPAGGGTTLPPAAAGSYASVKGAGLGRGADLNGAIPFPADNAWNTDVSALPADPNSANLIASIGLTRGLHPDFGAGLYEGAPIGIPYVIVGGTQPKVPIHFVTTWNENDPGPYPVPADAPVEGEQVGVPGAGGDRHVLVIDRDNDRLYVLVRAFRNGDGSW
ncbi:MAG: hypothetical protein AB7G13_33190, partial [Lautropia sp.]